MRGPDRTGADDRAAEDRGRARLQRQFDSLRAAVPWLDGWIRRVQADQTGIVRVPVALLLIVGGFFAFLPVLGLWMIPLGLMLLAVDVPFLRGPVSALVVRTRRRVGQLRRRLAAWRGR